MVRLFVNLIGQYKSWVLMTVTLLLGLLAACSGQSATPTPEPTPEPASTDTVVPEAAAAVEKTIYVGPFMVDCEGVAPQKCLLVKGKPEDQYGLFYDPIEGFDYEEGYEYELRVREEEVPNPPADASSLKWTLVQVVNKRPSLEGRSWQLDAYVNNEGQTVSVLPDTEVTAEFRDGQVSGNAGCNNYFGPYQAAGNSLTVGEVGATQMLCADEVNQQESTYLAALGSAATYQVSDEQLQIADADGTPVLSFKLLKPASLTGTPWQMLRYNNGRGGMTSALRGTEITIVFGEDGRVSGSSGCNSYLTSYQVDGNNITIGPEIAGTQMLCPEEIMEQERAFLAALASAATYEIRGGTLELRDADGTRAVTFNVLEPLPLTGTTWQVLRYNNGTGGYSSVLLDTEITAVFGEDGRVSGSSGCNSYSTDYQVDGNNITVDPQFAATRMMCNEPEGIMEQEQAYLAALGSAATYEIQGDTLEMRDAEGTRMLTFITQAEDLTAIPGVDIVGIVWKWERFTDPSSSFDVDDPEQYTIELHPEGRFTFKADCNSGAGTYTIDGSNITFEFGAITLAACPPGSLSDQFLQNLGAAAIYFMEGDNLFIDLMADSGTMRFAKGE